MSNSIKTKSTAAMAGVLAAALIAAALYSPAVALAQENRGEERRQADGAGPLKTGFKIARGAGIATDAETGQDLRSAFRIAMHRGNETGEQDAVRGMIIVSTGDQRVRYTIVPDTWEITVAEDGKTFEAGGAVQNAEGAEYRVSLDGYFGMHTRLGNSWSVEGTMEGDGVSYDLHYVALSHPAPRTLA